MSCRIRLSLMNLEKYNIFLCALQNDQMAYDVAVDMGHEEIASILEEEMRRRNIRGKWKKAAKKAKFCVIL